MVIRGQRDTQTKNMDPWSTGYRIELSIEGTRVQSQIANHC